MYFGIHSSFYYFFLNNFFADKISIMQNDTRTAEYGEGSMKSGSLRHGMESVHGDDSERSRGESMNDADLDKNKSVLGMTESKTPKISKTPSDKPISDASSKTPKLSKTPSDDFDIDDYKAKSRKVDPKPKKPSVYNDHSSSKQYASAEDMTKASYEITEDVLDVDKAQEPWINSDREDKSGEVICSTHQESPVIMHCKTCDRLVCDECIISTHKPHDLIEIRKQGLQDKLILGERLPDVKTRAIPSLKKNLEALNHTKSKSTEKFDNMINQIKQRSSTLISTIEIAKNRLINRCISDKDASHTFLNKLEDKLSTGIAGIESAAHSSEQALKMDRDPPIVHERIKLQWLLDKYRKSYPHIVYPKFQNGTAPREEAALEKMIGYFDGMLKCEARDQLHKIMLNVTPLGSLKPSYIKTMSYVHKVRTACAAGDDRVCIVPVVPVTSLDIFTSEGVSVLTQVPHTRIYDITRTMDSHFLVSDPRSKKVMRITHHGVVVRWTNVNGIPRGLHACKNGDILLCVVDSVAFYQNRNSTRHIVRMNENFNIIETYGKNEQIFNIPDRIFENVNGDICVIDRIGGIDSRLVVLDCHGNVRFEYPGEGGFDGTYGDGYLPVKRQAFSDVCCDGYANIYVSDERNSEIIVLDPDGNEQKGVEDIFMKKKDNIESIISPHRIVVDHNGRLWVMQRRKISLFSLYSN
jgi:hypothetical protein